MLYRADRISRRTRVYGVIGNPIGHSLSPRLQNAGFQARRMNAVYLPFLVRDLKDFLESIEPLGINGFSVTLPHKETILAASRRLRRTRRVDRRREHGCRARRTESSTATTPITWACCARSNAACRCEAAAC